MKKVMLYMFILVAALLFGPGSLAFAQESTPEAIAWTGEVSGRILNGTTGSGVGGEFDVMLHGWDQSYAETLMLHGVTAADGSYLFEEVAFEPDTLYAVMVTYEDTSYLSKPFVPEANQPSLAADVTVYETTTDLSSAQVSQMHALFFWGQGGLNISEVYTVSNSGDKTIKGAEQLDDGTPVTLKFGLPDGAANVSFGHNSGSRFLQFEGGFADINPLTPGENSSQVMVSYVLSYQEGMVIKLAPPLNAEKVSVLVPQNTGLSITGEGLALAGEWSNQNGQKFSILSLEKLEAGKSLQLTLSGNPSGTIQQGMSAELSEQTGKQDLKTSLGLGGAALGLGLVLVGILWLRRPMPQSAAVLPEAKLNALVTEIALLDQANDLGKVPAGKYISRRAELLQQAQAAYQEKEENPNIES